jgi:hypothetical protein
MRLVLCVFLTMLLNSSTFAAQRTLTRAEAQEAVASGDAQAAGALTMTTDQGTCLNECTTRRNAPMPASPDFAIRMPSSLIAYQGS